jgi:hypothetical protein
MPAKSRSQQVTAAIAEHDPSKLYARNRGMASMKLSDLHEFASGSMKGKPEHVKPARKIHTSKRRFY